jgi:acetolactate synthase-1/2/3 large subunit
MTPEAQRLYGQSDFMLVAGSRLRGNETRNNEMKLPRPLYQVDADAAQSCRNYPVDFFVHGDARLVLEGIVGHLPPAWRVNPQWHYEMSIARAQSEGALRQTLGPYQMVAETLLQTVPAGRHPWVRDVTIANSTFGNRYVQIAASNLGVHAAGGGIGQGLPMAIGASLASANAKTIALSGDGGLMLCLGELATLVEEKAPVVLVLMNDKAYGVIQNIQDAQYQGRRHYSAPVMPEFRVLAQSIGLAYERITRVEDFASALDRGLAVSGPILLEVDMRAIGPFAQAFGGPPAGAAGGAR